MYYQCTEHAIAYQNWRQFTGHWMNKHPGEPIPSEETVQVEALSEGVMLAPEPSEQPWAGKPPSRRRQPKEDYQPTPLAEHPGDQIPYPEDEDARRLYDSLNGIGVPDLEARGIVRGWQRFSMVRAHPMNLHHYIVSYISRLPPAQVKAIAGLVPMVDQEMFPLPLPEGEEPGFFYPAEGKRPQAAYSYPLSGYGPPGYAAPVQSQPYPFYLPRAGYPAPAVAPDPVSKRLEELEARLAEEQAERRRERQEAKEEARARVMEERFATLAQGIQDMRDLFQKSHEERGNNLGSSIQQRVEQLAAQLGDERQKGFENSIAKLAETQKDQYTALVTLSRYISEGGQPGKSMEDLIAQIAPTILDKVEKAGEKVVGEMQGIREGAMRGGLPGTMAQPLGGPSTAPQVAPRPPGPRTQEALRVAQVAQAEAKVLEAAAPKK